MAFLTWLLFLSGLGTFTLFIVRGYSIEIILLAAGIALFFLSKIMKKRYKKFTPPIVKRIYDELYEWVETGWSAVILASIIMYFVIQAFKIPSGSMRMTLLEGDHLFVNKFIYGIHVPFSGGKRILPVREVKRGDIIIFQCPPEALSQAERMNNVRKDFVKRCVAVGGDMVEIRDRKLFVNGKAVEESYVQHVDSMVYPPARLFSASEEYQRAWEQGRLANLPPDVLRDNFGPVIVPAGHYFVMGDNRDRSFDSRFWGPMPDNLLKGTALIIYWPPKRIHLIK